MNSTTTAKLNVVIQFYKLTEEHALCYC